MLKFIVLIVTAILITLCVNINIDEPNIMPNVIETPQNNIIIIEEDINSAENTITENIIDSSKEEPVKKESSSNTKNNNTKKETKETISKPENKTETSESKQEPSNNNTTSTPKDTTSKQESNTFSSKEIPDSVYKRMLGNSIPTEYKDKVDLKTLRYLQITYFGFDGKTHIGEMVVNSKLANDVLAIFKELYEIKYPIEKIKLIDDYNANDEVSMSNNNTSCFCYRVVSGSTKLSNHAKRMCNRYKSTI